MALLIRRLRDQCAGEHLQVIGTSATMSSEGSVDDRRAVVAQVATRLFGSDVVPDRVIGETLVRATSDAPLPTTRRGFAAAFGDGRLSARSGRATQSTRR